MAIDLLAAVSKFDDTDDRETDAGFFRTCVPWVAPLAHLHIIFKPAPADVLTDAAKRMRMPPGFVEFLKKQNGAILSQGVLASMVFTAPGSL